jgi:hypothetical protein
MTAVTDVAVVDCGADDAEFRIVGEDDTEQTFAQMQFDPDVCSDVPGWDVAVWVGEAPGDAGTTYCAAVI